MNEEKSSADCSYGGRSMYTLNEQPNTYLVIVLSFLDFTMVDDAYLKFWTCRAHASYLCSKLDEKLNCGENAEQDKAQAGGGKFLQEQGATV